MIRIQPIDLGGIARVQKKLDGLKNLSLADMRPCLIQIQKIWVEGNRKGILTGIDTKNQPAPPLVYRMGKGRKTNPRKAGFGKGGGFNPTPMASAVQSKYQFATGPRLAPFRAKSRVITNFVTQHGQDGNTFFVEAGWGDVVSRKGVPFLRFHFNGMGRNPKYDLRGIRPEDLREMAIALRAHVEVLWLMRRP